MEKVRHASQSEHFFSTRNTLLAAGLAAFEVPFYGHGYSKRVQNGEEVVAWYFQEKSKGGKWKTGDLLDWWYSDDWFAKNYPKHPWSVVISALLTKEYLVAKIKNEARKVEVVRKNKTWRVFEGSEIHKRLTIQLK